MLRRHGKVPLSASAKVKSVRIGNDSVRIFRVVLCRSPRDSRALDMKKARAITSAPYRVRKNMARRIALSLLAALSIVSLSGCVPVAIGAGGAIAADTIVEDRGGDLF